MRISARALIVVTVLPVTVLLGWKHSPAQVVPAAVGPGAYVAVGAGASGFQAVYGERYLGGGFIYADVHPQWRVGFEGEARFLRYHTSEQVTESNYIGGIRVLILRSHGVEPYAKFLAGMGKITLPFGNAHGSFLAYAPGAGLDVALNHNVTVRAIDFEYQHWPQFPYGSFSPYGISSGVRVRVTPIARIPQSVRKRAVHIRRAFQRADPAAD
jgi:opacity protein-like surface antigen